jgi:hypothetical protein
LGEFLFGSERSGLQRYPAIISDLQDGRCFYCTGPLQQSAMAVDHFIPWSRYPVDLGHNFLLTHSGCNGRKADYLAAETHLARWLGRNRVFGLELGRRFDHAGIVHDWPASVQIACWAYSQEARTGGRVWLRGGELRPLSQGWGELFRELVPPTA